MSQLQREMDYLAREGKLRFGRATVYAVATYMLLWFQSVYEGSFFLVSFVVFLLAMTRRSMMLIQVLLGILFVITLLSDPIKTVAQVIT